MYIIGIGIITFLYMYYNFSNANQKKYYKNIYNLEKCLKNKHQNITDKYKWTEQIKVVNNDIQEYHFQCEILKFKYYQKKLANFLKKEEELKNNKNIWNENIKKVNNEIKNIIQSKHNWFKNIKLVNTEIIKYPIIKNFNSCLLEITNTYHYCRWVYDNNIDKLKNNKLIILDFKAIYNYETNSFISKKYVENLSKFSHKHHILFVIISELHPTKIPEFKFINKNNIITPYNYQSKAFGKIIRLKDGQLNTKAPSISINKIILDIFNRYGMNYDNSFYIGINLIPKLNCLILDMKSN